MEQTSATSPSRLEMQRRRWDLIDTLRSNKYIQGRSALRSKDNTFCCLGVACDLLQKDDWILRSLDDKYYTICGSGMYLPKAVQEAYGFSNDIGRFETHELSRELKDEILVYTRALQPTLSLAALNDYGAPFSLISKVIEAQPKGLFIASED